MRETQQSICEWGTATFGSATALSTATRMNIEVAELLSDLGGHQDLLLSELLAANTAIAEALSNRANWLEANGLIANRTPNGKECCDIQVVLYQVAERCSVKLVEATNDKMLINRERTWERTKGGRYQHT